MTYKLLTGTLKVKTKYHEKVTKTTTKKQNKKKQKKKNTAVCKVLIATILLPSSTKSGTQRIMKKKKHKKKNKKQKKKTSSMQSRPVNCPGYPVILTVLPLTNDLPSDFYKKRQTNGFRAVYWLILTTETKKKTYPGFSVLTQTKSRSLQISG